MSFQNLDIRLDVLQQELHLPLNIVSGHIHELTVRVPWTKIASEPIQINVNTIGSFDCSDSDTLRILILFVFFTALTEFVVKLKSDGGSEKCEKQAEAPPAAPIIQEPPGYMASLINKIANNISINLNNIIFKYIEEDIVLTMNVQTLSIDSANDDWQPAFIDINSTKVTLKKVINVHDLTICLDRPNAQGKIDVCQEPILYRCSLQARMIRKYNLQTAHLASMTRIDVFTDNIDFKISVQQVPMLIRLYLLIQMLREVHTNRYASRRRHKTDTAGSVSGSVAGEFDGVDNSYATWIWNMLPEIFPPDVHLQRRPGSLLCHRIPMSRECICVAVNNRIDCFCNYFQGNWTHRPDWHNFVFRHIVLSMGCTDPSGCRQSHRICIANFCISLPFRRCHRCNGRHCHKPVIALNRSHRCIENVQDIRASHNRPRLIDLNIGLLNRIARLG